MYAYGCIEQHLDTYAQTLDDMRSGLKLGVAVHSGVNRGDNQRFRGISARFGAAVSRLDRSLPCARTCLRLHLSSLWARPAY